MAEEAGSHGRRRSGHETAEAGEVPPGAGGRIPGGQVVFLNGVTLPLPADDHELNALLLYTTDGRLPIDNNETEHLMKQIATGRKNWMHIGSLAAGIRAAHLMTIISTAARNDLDVGSYLQDVLDQTLGGCTDWESLRADHWKQQHPETVRNDRLDERRNATDRRRARRTRRRLQAGQKK